MANLKELVTAALTSNLEAISKDPDKPMKGHEIAVMLSTKLEGVLVNSIQVTISSISKQQIPLVDASGKTFLLIKKVGQYGYFRREFDATAAEPAPVPAQSASDAAAVTPSDQIATAPDPASSSAAVYDIDRTDTKLRTASAKKKEQEKREVTHSELEEKFRSLLYYFDEVTSHEPNTFPLVLKHELAKKLGKGQQFWRFPDYLRVVWSSEVMGDEDKFIPAVMETKKALGESAFMVESWELKVSAEPATVRENFFQTLSNSSWSHRSVLAFATRIDDDNVLEELRNLGTFYKVRIVTFNLRLSELNQCQASEKIYDAARMDHAGNGSKSIKGAAKAIIERWEEQEPYEVITPGEVRAGLDWTQLNRMQHPHIEVLQNAISTCLKDGQPRSFFKLAERLHANSDDQDSQETFKSYIDLFKAA